MLEKSAILFPNKKLISLFSKNYDFNEKFITNLDLKAYLKNGS